MVYFILNKANGLVKIGCSKDPKERIKSLMWEYKTPLDLHKVIEGSFRTEKYLHNKYKSFRVRGEWFSRDVLDIEDYFSCPNESVLNEGIKNTVSLYKDTEAHYDEIDKHVSEYEDIENRNHFMKLATRAFLASRRNKGNFKRIS